MDRHEWATRTLIRCLQKGHLPKSLKEKIEKVFRPTEKAKKKDKPNV